MWLASLIWGVNESDVDHYNGLIISIQLIVRLDIGMSRRSVSKSHTFFKAMKGAPILSRSATILSSDHSVMELKAFSERDAILADRKQNGASITDDDIERMYPSEYAVKGQVLADGDGIKVVEGEPSYEQALRSLGEGSLGAGAMQRVWGFNAHGGDEQRERLIDSNYKIAATLVASVDGRQFDSVQFNPCYCPDPMRLVSAAQLQESKDGEIALGNLQDGEVGEASDRKAITSIHKRLRAYVGTGEYVQLDSARNQEANLWRSVKIRRARKETLGFVLQITGLNQKLGKDVYGFNRCSQKEACRELWRIAQSADRQFEYVMSDDERSMPAVVFNRKVQHGVKDCYQPFSAQKGDVALGAVRIPIEGSDKTVMVEFNEQDIAIELFDYRRITAHANLSVDELLGDPLHKPAIDHFVNTLILRAIKENPGVPLVAPSSPGKVIYHAVDQKQPSEMLQVEKASQMRCV